MKPIEKAIFYFFILPKATKNKLLSFLTPQEHLKLIQYNKDIISNYTLLETISKHLIFFNHRAKGYPLSYMYGVFLLILCIGAFINLEWNVAIYYFIYLGIGFYILHSQSNTYWKLRFFNTPINFHSLLFTVLLFLFLFLFMNWYLPPKYIYYNPILEKHYFFLLQAVLVGPIIEEIIFRDYIYESLTNHSKRQEWLAIIVTSILFSMIHIKSIDDMVFNMSLFFIAGLLLGILRWYTKSLLYPTIVHIALNSTLMMT